MPNRPRVLRLLAAAFIAVLALAACNDVGGDLDIDNDILDDDVMDDDDVTIQDNSFEPDGLTISTGESVGWTNEGSNPHTVTFDDGVASDQLGTGDSFERTFDEPGEYSYICSIHPDMEATVTVED